MVDIRPKDLPAAGTVSNTAALVIDNGVNVEKSTPMQIVDAAVPLATQAEAEAGTDNAKRVSPLRVNQYIAAQLGSTALSTVGSAIDQFGNVTVTGPNAGSGWWDTDAPSLKFIQNSSRAFFGVPASSADGQTSGTNWVSQNFDHYLVRSNTVTSISVVGGTALFGATRNGDRYRQPALATTLAIWQGGQAITVGQYRGRNGRRYIAATSGTTGATPPTHTSGTVSDGGVSWTYVDNRGQYFTPIGISALAFSEIDEGEGTWSFYSDITRGSSGGTSFNIEFANKNQGTNVFANPFNMLPAGSTIGAWFAGGGDNSYGGAAANPSTSAMSVYRNSHSWNAALLIGANALTIVNGRATAVGMGPQHAIQWNRADDQVAFEMRSDGGVAGRDTRIVSNGFTTEWRGVDPSGVEQTTFSIAQSDLSAANSRTNFPYFDRSVNTTGGAGNGWIKTQAAGFDNNIDHQFVTKGVGVHEFGKNGVFGTYGGSPNYVGSKSDSTIIAVEGSQGSPVGTAGAVGYFQKYSNALSYNTLAGIATKTRNATNARATGIFGEATDVSGGTTTFVEGGRLQGILGAGDSGSAYGLIAVAGTNPSGPTNPAYLVAVEGEVTKQVGGNAPDYTGFNTASFSTSFLATIGHIGGAPLRTVDAAIAVNPFSLTTCRTGFLLSSAVDHTGIAALAGTSLVSGLDIHLATISYAGIWLPNNVPVRYSNAAASTGLNILYVDTSDRLVLGEQAAGISLKGSATGFNSAPPIAKPTVSGSRGGNAALASVLTQLANYGLITDGTSA